MNRYSNKIEINGQEFTHSIDANSYKEAVEINRERKKEAARKGRRIYGRLTLECDNVCAGVRIV